MWAYDRCGANNCSESPLDPVLEFDQKTGKLLRHFGAGMLVQQHGMHVDKQGNVWIRVAVDHQGNVYGAEVGPKDLKRYVKR